MNQTRYPWKSWIVYTILYNMVNNNSIFNTKYGKRSFKNGKCSFIFTTLLVHTTNSTIFTKEAFLYFSQFSSIPILFVHKILLAIPTNIPLLYTSAIFHLPLFAFNYPNSLHQHYFPYLNHFANLVYVKEPGS